MTAPTPEQAFADLVAREPSRPFVTYYDEASGERTELSVRSLANWVAKTHFLLTDELGLGVGDTAAIALRPHWISVPIVLGCLSAGLELTSGGGADVGFVEVSPGADTSGAVDAPDVYAVGDGMAAAVGFRGQDPPGTVDYVAAVRPQADAWASVRMPATAEDPCLDGLTRRAVVAEAAGLPAAARVLSTRAWTSPQDWITTLLAPLVAGGSVVYVRHCDDETVLDRRRGQEHVDLSV